MSTLVSRVLSQADKLPIINSSWIPSYYYSSKKEEAMMESSKSTSMTMDEFQPNDNYTSLATPRYSMAPPSYENVVKEDTRRFGNALSTIWKRASFSSVSSSSSTNNESKNSTTLAVIDKKQMEHAVTLINVATDMNNSGNQQMAIDLYMMGLDKLISALPLEADLSTKASLEKKIEELKSRFQLSLASLEKQEEEEKEEEEKDTKDKSIRTQLSNLVINAAVASAVALKKSPLPDTLSSVMNYAVENMQTIDEKHQIRRRTWDLAASGLSKAIEIDRHYEIHQMITGAAYTGFTAFVKAGLAYAETESNGSKSTA